MKSVMAGEYTAPPAHGPMIAEICGTTPLYKVLRRKISAYPASDITPSDLNEIRNGRRIYRPARTRSHDRRDLWHHAAVQSVAQKNIGVSRQRHHAFRSE